MIASVIAHLELAESTFDNAINSIAGNRQIEIGELIDGRLLPMTIEAESGKELDDIHQWLRSIREVEFVDVVFVQFDDVAAEPAS